MDDLEALYAYADERHIDVDFMLMHRAESLSLELSGETSSICMDPSKLRGRLDEKMKLSHELGHCETGAFYHEFSPYETLARQERKAVVWQIKRLIPPQELAAAVKRNICQTWELAEHFGVSEDLMRQAVLYYQSQQGSS